MFQAYLCFNPFFLVCLTVIYCTYAYHSHFISCIQCPNSYPIMLPLLSLIFCAWPCSFSLCCLPSFIILLMPCTVYNQSTFFCIVIEMEGGMSFIWLKLCCTVCHTEIKLSKQTGGVHFSFNSLFSYLCWPPTFFPLSFVNHIFYSVLPLLFYSSFHLPIFCLLSKPIIFILQVFQFCISSSNSHPYVQYNLGGGGFANFGT